LLAGHYCYSDDRVIEIKNRLAHDLRRLGCDLDEELKKPIRASFEKYLSCYGWLG